MRSGRLVTIVTVFAAAFSVNGPRAGADTVAVNCATGSLQTKIDNASPGTVILVKGTCDGTFVIPKNLTLKGNPTATLDGGSTGATLTVTGTRVIHLRSLVVTGGLGEAGGGIAMADGGVLTLDHVAVRNNVAAQDSNGFAIGGGIFAMNATVRIHDSQGVSNRAAATKDTVAGAHGGGLYLQEGALTVTDSLFQGNRARGDASAGVTDAAGGAVFAYNASVDIDGSRFQGNRAISVSGESGTAQGGAIFHQTSPGEPFSITDSTFGANLATATVTGAHTALALAGAVKISSDTDPVAATVEDSLFQDNQARASSPASASAEGGAIEAGGEALTLLLVLTDVLDFVSHGT